MVGTRLFVRERFSLSWLFFKFQDGGSSKAEPTNLSFLFVRCYVVYYS